MSLKKYLQIQPGDRRKRQKPVGFQKKSFSGFWTLDFKNGHKPERI
jgi:hypothetical protein